MAFDPATIVVPCYRLFALVEGWKEMLVEIRVGLATARANDIPRPTIAALEIAEEVLLLCISETTNLMIASIPPDNLADN